MGLWEEIKARLDELLPDPPGPVVTMLPLEPGDDPSGVRVSISRIPLEWFMGKAAGELRAAGFKIDPTVPDCATVKRRENGLVGFDWVEVSFTIDKDGKVECTDR